MMMFGCVVVERQSSLQADEDDDLSSSDEQSSITAGDYGSVTVALAVGLGAALAVLAVILTVIIIRRVRASRKKNPVEYQHVAAGGGPRSVSGSLPSWGFDSFRSKYSIGSEIGSEASVEINGRLS